MIARQRVPARMKLSTHGVDPIDRNRVGARVCGIGETGEVRGATTAFTTSTASATTAGHDDRQQQAERRDANGDAGIDDSDPIAGDEIVATAECEAHGGCPW